ncbi:anillin-like [Pelodytes ibericus]
MDNRRQPMKRLCSESGNDSPRKKRFTVLERGEENWDPVLCEQSELSASVNWSSLLRITEHDIKPDTPAIPSIRSRIQTLQAISRTDPVQKADAERIQGNDVGSVCGKFQWDETMEEHPTLPLAQSTIGHQRTLQQEIHASVDTASRLRKERQEELALVCAAVDRTNPWRADSIRHRQKMSRGQVNVDGGGEQRVRRRVKKGKGRVRMGPSTDPNSASSGSDSGELSLTNSEGSLDIVDDRFISCLEVRLSRTLDSDSSKDCSLLHQDSPVSPSRESMDLQKLAGELTSDCIEEAKSQVTMDNSELIDRLFEGVLDSSNGSVEEQLELPPISLLSPLTKSADLQAAISPLNSVVSSLPELLEETAVPTPSCAPEETRLPYSIDAYRTMRRNMQADCEVTVTPQKAPLRRQQGNNIGANLKERIKILSKEVSLLQRIIEQSCRALSCCVDAEHGKGSRQEAEAERLLLVSMERKQALLKELDSLRGERSDHPDTGVSGILKPCHGSITISDIRLPLKVDYLCANVRDPGNPGHFFLILIRFGAHDIVVTPLASASDAHTGDTILFPTTVTVNDTTAEFKIEIEVYSLERIGSARLLDKHKALKPKITPKKLLGSRKSSVNSPACSPALSIALRSSSFILVGSLTLSLDSLGKFKFPLEKMKLEGKVGRLLGNHFQDKVPFLSPLEGNLYLKLQCQSHSSVQRRGFLTMFEDVSGLGAWHRRWCVLSGKCLSFWAYPDQESSTDPLGQINLANCTSAVIEAARRETCARPHTLELITMRPQCKDDTDTLVTQCRNTLCFTKNWLSADDKEQRNLWMESLNQVLVDLRTWRTSP